MSDTTTLARPYAKAAFSVARASSQLPAWSHALQQLAFAVTDPTMQSVLKNPQYTETQITELFLSILHVVVGNGFGGIATPVENFVRILSGKKRLNLLPSITALLEEDYAKESGYLSLIATSAFELNAAEKNTVTENLSKQFQSKLKVDFQINQKLIGGLLVRSNTWVMDGTISGNLNRLKNKLIVGTQHDNATHSSI